ncbi:hypothetical protein EIP91_005805 [Steccherinum ochraceum]|uniref:Uncharacterized protein n=1 Tax=Steccherinum ochraceum TaxID=92696 RepID=A0A4R0RF44_9APHY|nr:hypothetical protein EIP91_005805 [Steccherinum ochraceum]
MASLMGERKQDEGQLGVIPRRLAVCLLPGSFIGTTISSHLGRRLLLLVILGGLQRMSDISFYSRRAEPSAHRSIDTAVAPTEDGGDMYDTLHHLSPISRLFFRDISGQDTEEQTRDGEEASGLIDRGRVHLEVTWSRSELRRSCCCSVHPESLLASIINLLTHVHPAERITLHSRTLFAGQCKQPSSS